MLQKVAQPFRAHLHAVAVLEGALGKGSSVKLLDRAVVYRQMPRVNTHPLLRGGFAHCVPVLPVNGESSRGAGLVSRGSVPPLISTLLVSMARCHSNAKIVSEVTNGNQQENQVYVGKKKIKGETS